MSCPRPGTVRTTCPYCGVGCGVLATPNAEGGVDIAGDPDHPANFGRLCSKGTALGETLGLETRLLHPEVGGERTTWPKALDHVAARLAEIRDVHGPDAIAFYLSGQLLTEDYYVANKLAKGFIGTPHVDTNSRLCMASSVAGHKRAFGADVVPQCYEDLEDADLIVLVGSNAAWCHPVIYQRIQAARAEKGTRVIAIDPRRTPTCEGADLHLAIRPGMDANLWNGLLVALADRGKVDPAFVRNHTQGFEDALAAARGYCNDIEATANATGLSRSEVETFFDWWCETDKVLSCYSQGVNQSAQGTDKVNAILNCHLATGRIGRPGSGPLSLTGQPNAMGGREVGGLANMLAAHMGFSEEERSRVERFWNAPNLIAGEGLKAVQMFDAIADGRIKAVWVMGTNPAVSLPDADRVMRSLDRLELLVVSENVSRNDTADRAHVRLPAAAWGEKDGTVTNSERRISRQRAFLKLAGDARPDWWILSQVALRLGHGDSFSYDGPGDIFREHATLSAFENEGERVFHIGALSGLGDADYDELEPVLWPYREPADIQAARLFADGGFATADNRGRIIPISPPRLAGTVTGQWPLVLNTGRVRDQWHTMTRTGLSPRLSVHAPEPYAEIHPVDGAASGIADGDLVRVETSFGEAIVRAKMSDGQIPGTLFLPIHWSGQNSSAGRTGALVAGAVDPYSGQPEAKATPARMSRVDATAHGLVLSRERLEVEDAVMWSRASTPFGSVLRFALDRAPGNLIDWAASVLPQGNVVHFEDPAAGLFRIAIVARDQLQAVAYLGPEPIEPELASMTDLFALDRLDAHHRRALLAGRSAAAGAADGPIVCVCFQIGEMTISRAIAEGCRNADAVGSAVKAGTNCGSCRPEINQLIAAADTRLREAAE